MYDFHHEEAIKCFKYCVETDPKCVLGYWGIAYSNVPNYNFYKGVGYYLLSGGPDINAFPPGILVGLCYSQATMS
jgi:hypothetical protein